MLRPPLKSLLPTLACLVGITALALAFQLRPPSWLVLADLKIQDAWMNLKTPRPEASTPATAVQVDIDQASLAEYGPWPWPRFILAELIQRLVSLGVAAVGLDLDLSEPDKTSPEQVADALRKWRELDLDLADLPDNMRDYDQLLAQAIEPLPVVLGVPGPQEALAWPLDILSSASVTGLSGQIPDPDGIIRRVRLVARAEGASPSPERLTAVRPGREVHLALSLRTLLRALDREEIILVAGPEGLEALQAVAPWDIPIDRDGGFTVFFKDSDEYPRFSAGDILAGRAGARGLRGRLAFISLTDETLSSLKVTPGHRLRPAGEIHAALIDSLAARHFVTRPAETPAIQFMLILGAGLTSGLAFAFARPSRALAGGFLWPAAVIGASIHLFQTSGLFISPIYAVVTTVLSGLVLAIRRSIAERKKARRLQTFSGRVSPATAARLARLEDVHEGAQEREVTVMAAEIRDFQGQPTADLLERALAPLTELVLANRGTLDNFRGDALLAFWNAPLPVPDHPAVAVAIALELRKAKEKAEAAPGPRPLKIGLGLHTGEVWAGRMGPPSLARYTLSGKTVSLGLKLEKLGRFYGVETVVSGATRKACGEAFAFQALDVLRLAELIDQPLALFTPLTPEEALGRAEELKGQERALALYQAGRFKEAQDLFFSLAASYPGCALYGIFGKRCSKLVWDMPKEWAGVWQLPASASE